LFSRQFAAKNAAENGIEYQLRPLLLMLFQPFAF